MNYQVKIGTICSAVHIGPWPPSSEPSSSLKCVWTWQADDHIDILEKTKTEILAFTKIEDQPLTEFENSFARDVFDWLIRAEIEYHLDLQYNDYFRTGVWLKLNSTDEDILAFKLRWEI